MAYTQYSGLIDCKVNDKVYVYSKKLFDADSKINKNMVGVVLLIEQAMDETWDGIPYLVYKVVIKMESGETITVRDDGSRPFFRKYEFITLKDLRGNYSMEIAGNIPG